LKNRLEFHLDIKYRSFCCSRTYEDDVGHPDVMYSLLKAEEYKNLIDFDNHLDNIALDWQNQKLNKIIDEAVDKYK